MTANRRTYLLGFLAAPRLAHAVLVEDEGVIVISIGESCQHDPGDVPPGLPPDAKLWGIDHSDGTGREDLVVAFMLEEGMLRPKYPDWDTYYEVTDYGRTFALGCAQGSRGSPTVGLSSPAKPDGLGGSLRPGSIWWASIKTRARRPRSLTTNPIEAVHEVSRQIRPGHDL